MDVKLGTKTFSDAKQNANWKSDGKESLSATEKKQFYNNDDIGAVLNKIADPNWVDPQKQIRTTGNANLDKDAFMKLLLTQMKNQDPTNPMQSHEMAAQLAQFTSLEKLTNIDESIKAQTAASSPNTNFESVKLIGKVISGDSSVISREDLKEKHPIRLNLLSDAKEMKVEIKDDDGKVIRTLNRNNVGKGRADVEWNGYTEDGQVARSGTYHVVATATGSNGKGVGVETGFEGAVTGVSFNKNGPTLHVGNQKVLMTDVKTIIDPTETQKAEAAAAEIAKKNPPKVGAEPAQNFIPIPETKPAKAPIGGAS